MRSRFDEQLALLNKEMIEMGALCEEVIALASKALTEADPELAQRVAPLDAEIDQKERNIESLCLKLLLQQQPVAGGRGPGGRPRAPPPGRENPPRPPVVFPYY